MKSNQRLLMKLAQLNSTEARRLFVELINDFALVGAMSEKKGSISFLLTLKLYNHLLSIAKLLPKETTLADAIRIAIGQGFIALVTEENGIGRITFEDADAVFRLGTGSKKAGDLLLTFYEEDIKRLTKEAIDCADSFSHPWNHPGF